MSELRQKVQKLVTEKLGGYQISANTWQEVIAEISKPELSIESSDKKELGGSELINDRQIAVYIETIRALKDILNRHIKTNGSDPRDVIGVFNTLSSILEVHGGAV